MFDVWLPNTKPSIDNQSDNMDKPTKLDFKDTYEEVNLDSNSNERQSIISNVERPPTSPLRRFARERRPVDILDPSPSLTQVGKSKICNKKLMYFTDLQDTKLIQKLMIDEKNYYLFGRNHQACTLSTKKLKWIASQSDHSFTT